MEFTKSLTSGFEYYFRPDQDRVRMAFKSGLIVLDTNVLLNVLRYSPSARRELLQVLADVAERCFVPHQVAFEYNRNRVQVVSDRRVELDGIAQEVLAIRGDLRILVNKLTRRQTLSSPDAERLEEAVTVFFAALADAQAEAAGKYDLKPEAIVGRKDEWTERLEVILANRVADKPSDEVLAIDRAEGERRKSEKLAPGFKDKENGDYLWWAETLRHPSLSGRALLVVSDDAAKGDWRFEVQGFAIGPHPILAEDVAKAGGTDLILLTTPELLQLVGNLSPNKVSEETLAESTKVLTALQTSWTFEAYVELLDSIRQSRYPERADVVVGAASQGGFIKREDVYEILGTDEDTRTLRHVVTPVQSVTRDLIARGLLDSEVEDALWAEYEGPGKAVGYSTPSVFTDFQRRLSRTV